MGMSKAHKLLGEVPASHDVRNRDERDNGSNRRRIFRTAAVDKPAQKKDRHRELLPSAALDGNVPTQHLHVRASSPLLGQTYRDYERGAPPVPKQTHVRPSGSSSALHSYFSSRKSVNESQSSLASTLNQQQQQDTRSTSSRTQEFVESGLSHKESKASLKESKRKMRPSRIDLSLLFPKPKSTEAPLLSPQRLTNSPSPISVVSEYPALNTKTPESQPTGRRLTKRPAQAKAPSTRKRDHPPVKPVVEKPRSVRRNNLDWFDVEFERTVGCSEIDVALSRFESEQKAPDMRRRVSPSRSAPHLHRLEDVPETPPSLSEGATRGIRASVSTTKTTNPTHLDPNASQTHHRGRSNSAEAWRPANGYGRSVGGRRPISKMSSRATLKDYDLNTSSVLCLSSSEDEADEEDGQEADEPQHDSSSVPSGSGLRDSVGTFDEFESEICTAEAAQATRAAPTLRRLERSVSTINPAFFSAPRQHAVRRNPSMSSAEKSSTYTADRNNRSRRSSGIPTISEPEATPTERPPQTHALSPSALEARRRSRIIAVTKQEQHLLEAMRQRQGKITPSLFQETRCGSSDTEQASTLSAPLRDRDSLYASDMSFLRLSSAFPQRVDHTVRHGDKDGYSSQGATSDGEQRTINSAVSPRTSLIYTDSVSSPGMSPLTPTLSVHRFSRQSQHPPPRRPPPAVPQEPQSQSQQQRQAPQQPQQYQQHQHPQPQPQPQPQDQRRFSRQSRNSRLSRHSRRRTDSSEAIVLDEPEDVKDHDEFPPWVYEWAAAGEQPVPVATVH